MPKSKDDSSQGCGAEGGELRRLVVVVGGGPFLLSPVTVQTQTYCPIRPQNAVLLSNACCLNPTTAGTMLRVSVDAL